MSDRACAKCLRTKPLTDFYVKSKVKGTYGSYCKPCSAERHREYYLENKTYYFSKNKRKRQRAATLIDGLKNRPCADCKRKYPPYVLDFDHLPGREKTANLAQLRSHAGVARINKEAAACEVVCANCHRIRTHKRKLLVGVT